MSDTPWTPGPWGIDLDFCVYSGSPEAGHRRDVADVCGGKDMPANARLIAAAPDMAEALEWYADQMCEGFCDDFQSAGTYHPDMDDKCAGCKARAALAKARGAA